MINVNTPITDFKEKLSRFEYSTPTRKSVRLLSKQESENDNAGRLKRTIAAVDSSNEEEEEEKIPTKKVRTKAKAKAKRGYASPEKYAHLKGLTDILAPDLDIVFCGINPGLMSATSGHHFANPSNHFWRALHLGGLTSRLLSPSEDVSLPQSYSMGMTNLVYRVSSEQAELSKVEMKQSVPNLLDKVTRYKPRVICFVGKGIWLIVEAVLKQLLQQHGKTVSHRIASKGALAVKSEVKLEEVKLEVKLEDEVKLEALDAEAKLEDVVKSEDEEIDPDRQLPSSVTTQKKTKAKSFNWGLQPYKFLFTKESETSAKQETLIYVMPSTSGRVVSHQLTDKVKLFKTLHDTVQNIKQGELDTSEFTPIPGDALVIQS